MQLQEKVTRNQAMTKYFKSSKQRVQSEIGKKDFYLKNKHNKEMKTI